MAGKGKEYYKSTYTHEQLWDMLHEGDDWSVEQAGTVWTSAASGMKAAREEMGTHVMSLRTQWTGKAAEEFENRMALVQEYSVESEEGMKSAGELRIPHLAQALKGAQTDAQTSDLYPSTTESYDDWLESNNIDKTKPEYQSKQTQYEQQYQDYRDQRHDRMAEIVSNLGDTYADAAKEWREPPPPPPSDMPGSNSYQPPTGGVFANNGMNTAGSTALAPGSDPNATTNDGLNLGTDDDLEPVDGEWAPGSYTDVDGELAGGLASGGVVPAGGGGFSTGMSSTGMGGASLAGGAGAGLFGPARGAGAGGSSTPGRGSGSSPARSGASSKTGSGSGRGGNQGRLSSNSRNAMNRGTGPRGGTRSGYNDDDEEEEYTRETWLREDDVNWSRNHTPDEELDD